MSSTVRVALISLVGTLALGCQDDIRTQFPDGLEPLEDNRVPAPAGGAPLERLVTMRGTDGFKWVHGRGTLLAPPGVIWRLVKDADLLASICDTDRHTITLGVEPQYEFGFKIHYEVDELVTVAWDELWRFGTITGTPTEPALTMVRYQKVFGSDFITTLEGSVQLLATADPGQTEIQMVEHLDAFGGSADQMEAAMRRRFASLAAGAHGTAPPTCP
jgi:hypothetical protein